MKIAAIVSTLLLVGGVSTCQAQVVSTYSPVVAPVPYVVYYPSQVPPSRVVAQPPSNSRVVTAYYQTSQPATMPQPQIVYRSIGGTNACVCPPALPAPYRPAPYRPVTAYRPLVPVMRMPSDVIVGRGILGQPTVYVPGQPIRNFLRYLGP